MLLSVLIHFDELLLLVLTAFQEQIRLYKEGLFQI